MKRRFLVMMTVLFYIYGTSVALAATCDQFRTDLSQVQQQLREVEFNRSILGINAAQEAARIVKSMCLDPMSSLDMTAFGFSPLAASLVARLAGAACKRLAAEVNSRVMEISQKVSQGLTNLQGQIDRIRNGASYANDLIEGIQDGSLPDSIGRQLEGQARTAIERQIEEQPGLIDRGSDYVAGQWKRLKDLLGPGGP